MSTWLLLWLCRRIAELEGQVADLEDSIRYDYKPIERW